MGNLLSLVVANFCMQKCEHAMLQNVSKKLSNWFRYVEDTFAARNRGEVKFGNFLAQINSIHPRI